MNTREMHQAQFSILRTLRHATSVRYSDLRRPTGLESDVFKFHLRKMVQQGYVRKQESGEYVLTPSGKEFANNLSKERLTTQRQPKLSVAIIASRDNAGRTEYLMQQRLRNPYFGFWGSLSGPIQWGESFEEAAERELLKQTGLSAVFRVKAFCRQSDHSYNAGKLLEDKLFVLVEAVELRQSEMNDYQRGCYAWLTMEELRSKERYFESTFMFVEMFARGDTYYTQSSVYRIEDY